MALSAYVDSFTIASATAATTTVARTGYGFQPKAIIVTYIQHTATTGNSTRGKIGFGVASGPSNRYTVTQDVADGGVSVEALGTGSAVMAAYTAAGLIDLQSFDADGVTFIVDVTTAAALSIQVTALGGDSLTSASVGQVAIPLFDKTSSVSGLGFQPTCVILMATDVGAGHGASLGFATTTGQASIGINGQHLASPNTKTFTAFRTDRVISIPSLTSDTLSHGYKWMSASADGFAITIPNGDANTTYGYLALAGVDATIISSSLQTGTGTFDAFTTLPSVPSVVVLQTSPAILSSSANVTSGSEWSIGMGTSTTNRASVTMVDPTALATRACQTRADAGALLVTIADSTPFAVDGELEWSNATATTLTLDQVDASPIAGSFVGLALGPFSGSGGGGGGPATNSSGFRTTYYLRAYSLVNG